jgi:PncC family amidohydrolase
VEIEIQIGQLLRSRNLKLVVAESCTGGLVGDRLTNIAGSSDYYLGSITAYANEAKQQLLGVQPDTLIRFGAVSEETVLEMAQGVRRVLAGSIPIDNLVGMSVTGIAGPGGGTVEKPVGLVWIGLSAPDLEQAWKYIWKGGRIENKALSAQQCLQLLLDYLEGKVK